MNTSAKEHSMAREACEIALLAVLIQVSGLFRIPGFFPGGEFQLSAPIAVAACGVFGFRKYIIAGVLASCIGLMLGTNNVFNVLIAMTFRVCVGAVWVILGSSKVFYIISGPIGTIAARAVLSLVVGKGFLAMTAAAAPGMVFTAATAWFFGRLLARCRPWEKPKAGCIKSAGGAVK